MSLRCILPLLACLALAAADGAVVAHVDGRAIAADEAFTVDTLTEVDLAVADGRLHLPAGSTIRLSQDQGLLTIHLDAGGVQVDLDDRRDLTGLMVRGASTETLVTGTLFVVVRDQRKVDTISLVRGSVQIKLREDIVAVLGRDPQVDLAEGQAVSGGPDGFGTVVPAATPPPLFFVAKAEVDLMDVLFDAIENNEQNLVTEAGDQIMDTVGPGSLFGPPPPP